jgi:hypothetical protein
MKRYLSLIQYPVHEPVNAYLCGLGNFEDPHGIEHKFRLLRLQAKKKSKWNRQVFQKSNQNTHYIYESLPEQQVVADLEFTTHQQRSQVWDFPEALRPEEGEREEICEVEVEEIEPDEAIPPKERTVTAEVVRPLATADLLGWSPNGDLMIDSGIRAICSSHNGVAR